MKPSVAIIIPVRIDFPERLRNLEVVLRELSAMHFPIWLLEADREAKCKELANRFSVFYKFVFDDDEVFYRTRYLNDLLGMCNYPIIGIWDTDIILHEFQIWQSVDALVSGKYILSSPYNGIFHYLTPEQSISYFDCPNKNALEFSFESVKLRSRPLWGRAFLVNRERYLHFGGENEHFYGWGPEDAERVHRMEILGFPVHRVEGAPIYHLWHPRGKNSCIHNKQQVLLNWSEFVKVCSMDCSELQTYIETW